MHLHLHIASHRKFDVAKPLWRPSCARFLIASTLLAAHFNWRSSSLGGSSLAKLDRQLACAQTRHILWSRTFLLNETLCAHFCADANPVPDLIGASRGACEAVRKVATAAAVGCQTSVAPAQKRRLDARDATATATATAKRRRRRRRRRRAKSELGAQPGPARPECANSIESARPPARPRQLTRPARI